MQVFVQFNAFLLHDADKKHHVDRSSLLTQIKLALWPNTIKDVGCDPLEDSVCQYFTCYT